MPTLAELVAGLQQYPRRGTLGALQRANVGALEEPKKVIGSSTLDALAKGLREPLPMEGRASFLPFMDTPQGRQVALPGLLAGAYNAFTAPSRAYQGGWTSDEDGNIRPSFDAPSEAQNVAMNLLGNNAVIAPAAPRNALSMIPAWHGSPHDIPMGRSMLMEKIGTGEGAQAYGHGLYTAESKDVGQMYKNKLGETYTLVDGKPANGIAEEWAVLGLDRYKNPIEAKEQIKRLAEAEFPSKETAQQFMKDGFAAVDRLHGKNVKSGIGGGLYKLELSHPDPAKEAATPLSPNDFLHWDLPLSQQPEKVKLAVKGILPKLPDVATGKQIYDALKNNAMTATDPSLRKGLEKYAEDASFGLQSLGIPGIRYLDGGSRGAGQGTYNYVLFDPKLANIVGKE